MKYDWNPSKVAFLDFETQSSADLTTVHKYASHPSTRALCLCVKVGGAMLRFGPYLDGAAKEKLAAIASDNVLVAHNAPFDSSIWEITEKLPQVAWYDTLPCSRAAGFPGQLDKVGTILTGAGKDKNGKRLIDLLCIVKGKVPAIGPAHGLLLDYCARDVELLEAVYNRTKGFGEPDVMSVDYTVNQRGIPINRAMLVRLLELYEENAKAQRVTFQEVAGVCPTSPKQVVGWMESIGFNVKHVNKAALREFMESPEDFYVGDGDFGEAMEVVQAALMARKEVTGVGWGKAKAVYEALEHDDRIREQLVYYGAHLGRWTGRGFQVHNLPSIVSRDIDVRTMELTYSNIVEASRVTTESAKKHVSCADILNAMLRHLVQPGNVLVADYGAVEARGTAWVAGCSRMLETFADPSKSVYLDMGQQIYGRRLSKKNEPDEYTLVKALVLGSNYGMSGAKFAYTCKVRGESAALLTLEKTGIKVDDLVKTYRRTFPEIPAVWKACGEAVMSAVNGTSAQAAKCQFLKVGQDMHIVLPSGRPIVYRNARIAMLVPAYCKMYGMPEVPVPTVVFDHPRGNVGFLYGSKVTENIVQGLCRDLLADALVKCEQAGLNPILHVHDEIACQAEESKLPLFMEILSTGPAWAKGFPILAEGYSGAMWTKNTSGYKTLNMLNGRIV